MIDTTKYGGHTKDWAYIQMHSANGIFGYFPICECDRDLLADAPIILEALKAAQARIAELEMVLMEHRKPPREYTDDELLDMSR
jgi:hypothetical protein